MKIKNLTVTSLAALDLELDVTSPVCVLQGEHSALVLDLIRELTQDYNAETDPDCCDGGHFVIHSDIELDGKNYSVCYIRNADLMGENRIAANFVPNSLDFSREDTEEFIDKCRARSKDTGNVIRNRKAVGMSEDDRPLFVYCEDAEDIASMLEFISTCNRQAFVAVRENKLVTHTGNVQTVFVG